MVLGNHDFLFDIEIAFQFCFSRAFHLAKFAYDEAIPGLKALSEDSYRDSTFIMEKLKDNLVWWTYEQLEDGHHIDCNGCYCRT